MIRGLISSPPAFARTASRLRRSTTARFRQTVALTALALASFAPLHAASTLDWAPLFTHLEGTTSVPGTFANGALLVDVKINGAGPFHLLVDTGCSASVISPEVALAVEAKTLDDAPAYMQAVNSLGATGSLPYVWLDSVELNGARFEGVGAGVMSLELQSRVAGTRIDGLLGYSLFSELFLTFDFPHQRLLLSTAWPEHLPPVHAAINLIEHSSVPFAVATTQGHSFELMIDTGANGSVELNADAASALDWKVAPRPGTLVAALGSTGRDWIGRLSGEVELGGVRQLQPVVAVTNGPSRVGNGFLRSLCVVFSRAQNKAWFCSPTSEPLPSPPRRSVGLSLLAEPTGWRIVGTIPDSPAESARLAPGDLIAAIENAPAHTWSREEIQAWIDTHPALTLSVSNATGTRELALPVWSLVP